MNYGDGVYGGIFVGALYSEAYFESNIPKLIDKALLSIPAKSDYFRIVKDVITLHDYYPADWRAAWRELEAKWGSDHICGAGTAFNIDAKLNGAYIVMGLLYGDGDPLKTLEIATRCGQDSDCNPSNALAVLGVVKGLTGLPVDYKNGVVAIGDSLFINTNYSFNKAVTSTVKYAKDLVVQNGGTITDTKLKIKVQSPQPFPLEKSFPKLVFDLNVSVFENGGWEFKGKWEIKGKNQSRFSSNAGDEAVFTFDGTGVSICGNWFRDCGKADIFVDGKLKRTIDGYFWFANQSPTYMELYHITNLQQGKHVVKVVVRGEKRPEASAANLYISKAVVFKTADKKNENFKFSFQ